jgi:hypothetical protein
LGLIRKATSLSTLGGVKYTSKREAQTMNASAQARLARAETTAVKAQGKQARPAADTQQWDDILAAIVAGEVSYADLGRLQKLAMPIGYQIRCKAAACRAATPKWWFGTAPGGWKCEHRHGTPEEAIECGNRHIRGES